MQTEKWFGASGRGWVFTVAALPFQHDQAGRNGNYVFCRQVGATWQAILIDQGELAAAIACGQADACVRGKGATHVHWRFTGGGEAMRREIDTDLKAGHPSIRPPSGCST
jgi:hypothetical protein